ncbi:MAG: hypothetical protein JNJ90_09680 [Saprospiraceae bacterium]|nr:hypothetical protein [Saprospiraceae bacterium]
MKNILQETFDVAHINQVLRSACGVVDFFENSSDAADFACYLAESYDFVQEPDRTAYGDFQTNPNLASRVASFLKQKSIIPAILIEPTFGKGNFIVAALSAFPGLQQIVGVEIYKPYVWATKFSILQYFLEHKDQPPPIVQLYHQDVFDFDFRRLSRQIGSQEVLILGNPPWVTNAQLGAMNVDNLPTKSNFKNLSGLDAMTGKGNFDIGEFITLTLLQTFQHSKGSMAFLVKNSVIKNLIFDQQHRPLHIGNIAQYAIDAKREFDVSVDASLLVCDLNKTPEKLCSRLLFDDPQNIGNQFGWNQNKFVFDLAKYRLVEAFDGTCPFEWRQGLKHDCSSVMELSRVNGHFSTPKEPEVHLEQDLVYGFLKSSDLKGGLLAAAKRSTIVTQRKVGQDTSYIKKYYPRTYQYLNAHWDEFAGRKSSIYRGKPPFSIFGIGDYSFMPYKVAISGLYKSPVFTLVLPESSKPLMLDDTCYFIGFADYENAAIAFALLNHPNVTNLLSAIAFADSKRMYTKEILQRIDLRVVAMSVATAEIQEICRSAGLTNIPDEEHIAAFLEGVQPQTIGQAHFKFFDPV